MQQGLEMQVSCPYQVDRSSFLLFLLNYICQNAGVPVTETLNLKRYILNHVLLILTVVCYLI